MERLESTRLRALTAGCPPIALATGRRLSAASGKESTIDHISDEGPRAALNGGRGVKMLEPAQHVEVRATWIVSRMRCLSESTWVPPLG